MLMGCLRRNATCVKERQIGWQGLHSTLLCHISSFKASINTSMHMLDINHGALGSPATSCWPIIWIIKRTLKMSGLSLGQQMCRTAGIFQGITAVPVMLVQVSQLLYTTSLYDTFSSAKYANMVLLFQGDNAFEELSFYYSYLRLYYFM